MQLVGTPSFQSSITPNAQNLLPAPATQIVYETTSIEEIERARAHIAGVVRVNLNEKYGCPEQQIKYVNGLGPAFIHGRTGTLYFLADEERKLFRNKTGTLYNGFSAQEDPAAFFDYDSLNPRVHLELPNDISALSDEMFVMHWWLDRHETNLPRNAR